MYKLTTKDYIQILNYYNIPIPKEKNRERNKHKKRNNKRNNKRNEQNKYTKSEKSKIKEIAEKILAEKLCRCIKTLDKYYKDDDEKRSIAICKKSVIQKKQLRSHKFTCKKGRKLISDRKHGRALSKTVKRLNIGN